MSGVEREAGAGELGAFVVSGGWLDGHRIRRARKDHRCDGFLPHPTEPRLKGAPCPSGIKAGQFYVEGEMDPHRAGGYACERYCGNCATAGPEARAAIARATGGPARESAGFRR